MTVKTYLQYKAYRLRLLAEKLLKNPSYLMWLTALASAYLVGKRAYRIAMLYIAMSVFLLIYKDYKRGDHVAWKRARIKEQAKSAR